MPAATAATARHLLGCKTGVKMPPRSPRRYLRRIGGDSPLRNIKCCM
jgi:hypothetical protein